MITIFVCPPDCSRIHRATLAGAPPDGQDEVRPWGFEWIRVLPVYVIERGTDSWFTEYKLVEYLDMALFTGPGQGLHDCLDLGVITLLVTQYHPGPGPAFPVCRHEFWVSGCNVILSGSVGKIDRLVAEGR